MQDFFCAEPRKMNYSVLADRVKYFKEEQEGNNTMCDIIEDLIEKGRNEVRKKEKINFAKNLIIEGSFNFEKISKLSGLTVDEVKNIASSKN